MSSSKSEFFSVFSIRGYSIRSDASKYFQSVLDTVEESKRSAYINKILDFVEANSSSFLIEKSVLEQAVHSLNNSENDEVAWFKVVDAFSMPAYYYHNDTKKFVQKSTVSKHVPCLYGQPNSKADVYVEKYKMIRQRAVRHKLFAPPPIETSSRTDRAFSLKSIEHLLGASSKQANLIVLGMLAQLKEAQLFLEDPTGCVKLDLSQTTYKGGLFTENSIVLAEGYYEDNVFHVSALGFPPLEPAAVTLSHYPYFDLSPGSAVTSYRLSEKLKALEQRNVESMFIFLSDVWLDQLKIMQKLQILFAGYSDFPPTCFVLIGNFLSSSENQVKNFQGCFEKLGNLICEFPSIVSKSTFVFVPGPEDPGLPHILPRPPIPEALLMGFRKKVPNAIFTSNPCRIQYYTQEIVIFREDILSKMCRNAIYTPWQYEDKVDIPSLFVKTIIANSHLLPLPPNVAPIYCDYDHAFWLYPLPDVVVCADKSDPYTIESTGTVFFNPGSLSRTNFHFKVYIPATKQVEDSQVTDEHLN